MVTVQAELVLATAGLGELLTAGEVAADGAAAEVAGEAPVSIEATEITGVQANRIVGNAAADELASSLEEAGLTVEREVYYDTPYGGRFADLQVSSGDESLGLVEVKVGNSPYTATQQLKDAYIQETYGLPTNVVRYPTYP
jgi:hypothetical protein